MIKQIITWSEEKNRTLLETRGVCFEEVVQAIENHMILADEQNNKNYPHQRLLVVKIQDYVYNVPYVIENEKVFLKTMFPSRKSKKLYTNK